jgi:hypothetical protein
MRHAQRTGAHFRGHAQAGKISGAERIFSEPFVRHCHAATPFIDVFYLNAGKKSIWQT